MTAEKIIKWLIRKLVTFYYNHYPFYTYSWGIDEHTDLHVISEESYFNKHRFGLKEEVIEDKNRLKADLVAMLTELQLEIEEIAKEEELIDKKWANGLHYSEKIIQQKIEELKKQLK